MAMAQRGRKKKLDLVAGDQVGQVNWSKVRCPQGLDEIGQTFWRNLVERLRSGGQLDRTDPAVVELAARAYSVTRAAHKAIERDGMFFEAPNMTLQSHPACKVLAAAESRLQRIMKDLGLVPTSKQAIGPNKDDQDDHWKGLLSVTG